MFFIHKIMICFNEKHVIIPRASPRPPPPSIHRPLLLRPLPVHRPRGIIPSTLCPPPLSKYKGVAAKPNYLLFRWPPARSPQHRGVGWLNYSAVISWWNSRDVFHSPLTCNPSSPLFPLALDPPPARPPQIM